MKKGRYSYEKRAETIIQSRSYWHSKYEGQVEVVPEQPHYMEHMANVSETYVEQVPSTSIHYTEEVNAPAPDGYVEMSAPMAAYEEEVLATPHVINQVPTVNDDTQKSTKSLREILGITDPNRQDDNSVTHDSTDNSESQIQVPSCSNTIWTSDSSQVYTNLQPVPYTIQNQGNGHIAASPGELSDDSGVYLLSPNNIPVCSPNVSSMPPVSPYKTVTIREPQTQAEIVEVVPGMVRSINMRREMVIDGKPVSYLLEGVLVASASNGEGNTESSRVESPPKSASPQSIADEMSIDGKPIALLLQNILDDIGEEGESLKENEPSIPDTTLRFAGLDQDLAVNQVMIDGKPIYQMFEMFSRPDPAAETSRDTVSLPSISTLAQKKEQPTAAAYNETTPVVPPNAAPQHPTSTQAYNTQHVNASYRPHSGENVSPTLNDIQETAQTLINMASMPMDSAITSTVSTDELQSTFIPDSATFADPNEPAKSTASNLTYYKPDHGNRAFINALISDNDSTTEAVEKLLKDGFTSRSPQEIKDLDRLIETIVANVERNKCITEEFLHNLPTLEQTFLVCMLTYHIHSRILAFLLVNIK